MFLCRESELQKLNNKYQSNLLECVIIYGRRRIGKTSLINEFVKDKDTIYFPALNSNAQDNLVALSKSIYAYKHNGITGAPVFSSFDDAFAEITQIASEKRIVFVIDELPYLVNAEPSILSRLQHLLDHDWEKSGMYLILCGSSSSFMEKEVFSEKSPLFGRCTMQLYVKPLSYLETAKFHPELSFEDNALIYGITGGVPHYINKLNVNGNIKEALLENFFAASSYLYEEPENLLKQELREPAVYNSIITAIADGNTKLTKIANAANINTSVCNRYMKTLLNLGIVSKVEPVIDKSKNKVQYRISDYLFRFWYRFVPGNMMAISAGTMYRIYDDVVESYLSEYMGIVFEDICRQYLLKYADDLPVALINIGEWWGTDPIKKKDAQLDVVAIGAKAANSGSGRKYIIGSCKYTNDKIDIGELELIKEYARIFINKSDTCYYYIFSKSGFTEKLIEKSKTETVKLISMQKIYRT